MSHLPGYRARLNAEGGHRPYVDGTLVGAHVRRLQRVGMSRRQIEIAAGVDYMTVVAALEGRRMQRDKAQAIMRVRPTVDSVWCWAPAAPTHALIDRLVAQGYSKEWIAEQSGMWRVPKPTQQKVRVFTARAIRELAAFVGDSPGVCRDGRVTMPRKVATRDPKRGGTVAVDMDKLRAHIDGPLTPTCKGLGISERQVYRMLDRGTCDYYTLDKIAAALSLHPSELEAAS